MQILKEKQLVELKNNVLEKIYLAIKETYEQYNSDETGAVKDNHEEILDRALKYLHMSANKSGNFYYDCWLRKGKIGDNFFNK